MQPARGDQRPCSCSGCSGTMQFGRESENDTARTRSTAPPAATAIDAKGWVCSKAPDHFLRAV